MTSPRNCKLSRHSAMAVAAMEFHPESPGKGRVEDGLYYTMIRRMGSYETAKEFGIYGLWGTKDTGEWLKRMIHVEK